jgi:16S rRNA (cytidine1402-2'-O)-methyltransferase
MSGRHFSKNSNRPTAGTAGNEPANHGPGSALADGVNLQLSKLGENPLAPGLYIVSTPIGNLSDITLRALFVLASADRVFCEDTRHSRKLFAAYGIGRKLDAYHDFSTAQDRDRILSLLKEGRSVALISDAGTPLIADPGFKLVRAAVEEGASIFPIPGPSAILAALAATGLPTDRFYFGGFLPPKDSARRSELEAARAIPGTLIFYETGSRLEETFRALKEIFPLRPAALARELTKRFETIRRGLPSEILDEIGRDPPAGEFVVLIGPGEQEPPSSEEIEAALKNAMARTSLKAAVEEVAKGLGVPRKQVYNLALHVKGEADERP